MFNLNALTSSGGILRPNVTSQDDTLRVLLECSVIMISSVFLGSLVVLKLIILITSVLNDHLPRVYINVTYIDLSRSLSHEYT